MIAAIIGEDPQAFDLHQNVVRTGRLVKKLRADPDANDDVLRAAETSYANAVALLHEKCALEAA